MAIILGIETSCDETSVAIIKNHKLLCNIVSSQIKIHRKYGGVVPEIASRLHTENIIHVLNQAIKTAKLKFNNLDAIAVTRGPGLIGALNVGLQTAKTLSFLLKIPLISVHHLAAHIYSCEFVKKFQFPLLALVVSGGNTILILMNNESSFKVVGETRDDAVGECFDKVARVLNLPYPGGPAISKLSQKGRFQYKLPIPLDKSNTYDFSYSGLKTAVINLVKNEKKMQHKINIKNLCFSFEKTAIDSLVKKVIKFLNNHEEIRQFLLAGGVSANNYLRNEILKKLTHKIDVIISPPWCTTDNAAMVVKLAEHLYNKKKFSSLDVDADPNWKIEDFKF